MKPLKYEKILKFAEEGLKISVENFKKLEAEYEEEEEGGFGRIREGCESSIEYWTAQIEILTTILGYTKKETNALLGGKYV